MDDSKNAYNKLKKGIEDFVRLVVDKSADKTYTAIIKQVNADGTYDIMLNGVKYNSVPTCIGNSCTVNETVYVTIPQGNTNNIFIIK